jgi:hypothetical protein
MRCFRPFVGVRPVVELHLRDACDLADLAQVELDLVEVRGEIDRLEQISLCAWRHTTPLFDLDSDPSTAR